VTSDEAVSVAGRVLAVALYACLFAAGAYAQGETGCKVHDPELQLTYAGACRDGWADGYGEARGIAATYRGEFKAGRKHGKGIKTWLGGDRYEGDFVEDRREGTGMYTWGRLSSWSRQRYTGGFVNDRRHGYGVYEWPNGDRMAGPWESDRYTGAPSKGAIARGRAYAEHAAAVGRVGATVCRELQVGVATRDTVRGTVTAVTGERITVRIDDPGKTEHTIGERRAAKGTLVEDSLKAWTPCVTPSAP
jgi:hypothetical protein